MPERELKVHTLSAELADNENHIRLALAEIDQEVAQYTYPLFGVNTRDRPELFASSILIECDGTPVLITAEHAIINIVKSGSAVHIGAKHITKMAPKFAFSSQSNCKPLDIAAMVFPIELMQSEAMKALPLDLTTFGRSFPSVHMRCIHGYPLTKNRTYDSVNEVNNIFNRFGFTYAGASLTAQRDYPRYNKVETKHVVLQYQRKCKNETGEKARAPKPIGMSGGGLWIIPNLFNPRTLYLEGISIEWKKEKSLVFATRIEPTITFIRKNVLQ